jgi:hypothetical protein
MAQIREAEARLAEKRKKEANKPEPNGGNSGPLRTKKPHRKTGEKKGRPKAANKPSKQEVAAEAEVSKTTMLRAAKVEELAERFPFLQARRRRSPRVTVVDPFTPARALHPSRESAGPARPADRSCGRRSGRPQSTISLTRSPGRKRIARGTVMPSVRTSSRSCHQRLS